MAMMTNGVCSEVADDGVGSSKAEKEELSAGGN